MSCFLDGWLKTEKSVHWLIHVRSHRSSISCHFHCAKNFSISDSLVLGLQIVHSSNFEYKLAFSSTKSNFSLTFSCLPQFTYFAPPHFVLFSLHHHHRLISNVFPPPSPLNFCCILSGTPTNNRLQLSSLRQHNHPCAIFYIHDHHHCISIFSTNTNTNNIFLLFSLHHPHQEHTQLFSLNHHHPCVFFYIRYHHQLPPPHF